MKDKSCWWIEGGKCYAEPCTRKADGTSTKLCGGTCEKYENKRTVLTKFFPTEKLVIMSENNEENIAHESTS